MNIYIQSVLAALAFSFLCYSKSLGLNLVLISILIVILITSTKRNYKTSWGYSFAYIFTALMVFFDPNAFKIFIHFMAFLLLIGKSISEKSSLYISWFIGLVNMIIASIFHLNLYLKNPDDEKKKLSPKTLNTIKGIASAIVLIIAFSVLYQQGNPVFKNLISQINLDFISLPWLFFTLFGYFIFLHILRPYHPEKLLELDRAQKNTLIAPVQPFTVENLAKLEAEHSLGNIIFIALNVLLTVFLITDVIYLLNTNEVSNAEYSESVHQGIYALLFSIVCAISIILYFFRGNLNFFQNNKRIKTLTYTWIILNVILVLFTWYKNYLYVEALGFTYKRIGVFVYLLLTITGLCTTYIKVAQIKSFIYLVRTNIAALFVFLFVSATIPWDNAITSYNLHFIKNPDIYYLINLGESNSYQLYKYKNLDKSFINQNTANRINKKYADFNKAQSEKTWEEYTLFQLNNSATK